MVYNHKLVLNHGGREFQFLSMTGDAEGTTVMYLPKEKIACTGDLVVLPVPYWTPPPSRTLNSLRELAKMDIAIIVPGHGPAQRDLAYLNSMIGVTDTVIRQVRHALMNGASNLEEVRKAVNVEEFRQKFTRGDKSLDGRFDGYVKGVIGIAIREAREQEYRN
jgi:glyoxylase-like metal-dependent hydrolase (beta-lactamase superfamily II)